MGQEQLIKLKKKFLLSSKIRAFTWRQGNKILLGWVKSTRGIFLARKRMRKFMTGVQLCADVAQTIRMVEILQGIP